MRRKVSGRNGKRSAFPDYPERRPQTQNKKRKSHMKNRNMQFKPTAGLLIPLLLACFAAVFISAPNSASAGGQVPFNATLSGYVETLGVSAPVHYPRTRDRFRKRDPIGSLHRNRRILVPLQPDPDLCENSTIHWQLSLVCGQQRRNLRHFRGVPDARRERLACTTTMKLLT